MTSDVEARAHVLVTGRVQGVFFRQSTSERARELGLSGWVRNLPDGRVEALVQGERASVQSLLAWIRHGGPPAAVVDAVEVTERPAAPGLRAFRVER